MLTASRYRVGLAGMVSAVAAAGSYQWLHTPERPPPREEVAEPLERPAGFAPGGAAAEASSSSSSSSMSTSPRDALRTLSVLFTAIRNITFSSGKDASSSSSITGNVSLLLAEISSNSALVDSMLSSNDARLLTWLLDQLGKSPESAERRGAERVLGKMLLHPNSAKILLSHHFSTLLDYVVRNEFSDISAALKEASRVIVLGSPSSPRVVENVLSALRKSRLDDNQGGSLSHICAWALACWSNQEETRDVLLNLETLSALAEVLGKGAAAMEDEDRALLLEATFNLLSPSPESAAKAAAATSAALAPDQVKVLLTPIIHNGAHAVANHDETLLAHTLNCLASLLDRGAITTSGMESELVAINLLLDHTSKGFGGALDPSGELTKDCLRSALAGLVRASISSATEVRVVDTEVWVPRLMTWLFETSKPTKLQERERGKSRKFSGKVYENALGAVVGLMSVESERRGVQVAREWLGHFGLALCAHHEEETARLYHGERGGATVNMLEERVKEAREASNDLLKASRNASITAGAPPRLPSGVPEVNANLPKAYAAAAIQVDDAVTELAASKAMSAMADLLSDDRLSQEWFLKSGALEVLHKLAVVHTSSNELDEVLSRLLAILSVHEQYKVDVESAKYKGWLQELSESKSCTVSSNAKRALLNSKSQGKHAFEIRDGVHLMSPDSDHHIKLVEACNCQGTGERGDCGIDADIVFVHGLNGGPFSSWCMQTEPNTNMSKHQCWPGVWLTEMNPNLRLLSLEYKTKVFEWEGAQHSFRELSAKMLSKLKAAGVGQRPVIFITHSMGGLMVKEMMMQASEPDIDKSIKSIVKETRGVVFYSTPHHGSWIASTSWNFTFYKLKDFIDVLRPGPYLEELNDFLRSVAESENIKVLSFGEATQTLLDRRMPSLMRAEIVPAESAYPGFGEFHIVQESDHIKVCKPKTKDDPAYKLVLKFLEDSLV